MTAASRVIPMLSVADLARALALYEGVLGGRKIYQFPAEGEAAFVTLAFGATELGLGVLGDGTGLHGRALRPASGHRIELCFNVADVDETVAAIEKLGLTVALAPLDQPWGERAAYIEDPDGNLVMLAAPSP